MIPFRYDYDSSYLENIERQARIAQSEEIARLMHRAGLALKTAFHAIARVFKFAHDDARRHAA